MQVLTTLESFRKALDAERADGRVIGLVPTMGYLHEGHLSLVRRAAADCDTVAVTIYVNPLQFGPKEDLARYPRDLERDRQLLERERVDFVFAPAIEEMRPSTRTTVRVAGVADGLEGETRPGHFEGVATIVAKLFAIAGPCRAYFGEKDWQQLQVVRALVDDLSFPVDVVGCPTVRDPDGLAMSSRNTYLSETERPAAAVLFRALRAGQAAAGAGSDPVEAMRVEISREPLATLDYAALDAGRLLVAARVGGVRLIDNAPLEG